MTENEVEIHWTWEFYMASFFVAVGIILPLLAVVCWFILRDFNIFLQLMIYAGISLIVALVFVVIMRYKGEKELVAVSE